MKYQSENFNGSLDYRSRHHQGWHMEIHLHEYSEILYCKSGEGNIYVNGKHIVLSSGQFVWLAPNYVHQYDCPDAEIICAVFSNDFIPLFFHATRDKRLCVEPIEAGELSYYLERLHTLSKDEPLVISGYLNLICSKVIKSSSLEGSTYSDHELYQKVITYISQHYTEDITLADVAKRFGYNQKYLSHTLHELTKVNFRQLLTFYRINHAKELLANDGKRSITEVAMMCGFCALNTFHRSFKEMTQMTPLEYRRKYGN